MTEQPPPSAMAKTCADEIGYSWPAIEHNRIARILDRFAARAAKAHEDAAVSAETERCARIANAARRKYRDMDAFIADEIYQDIRGATVGRAPGERPDKEDDFGKGPM